MAKKKDDVYIAMLRAVRELSVAGKSVERDQVVDKIHAGYNPK